MPNLDNVFQNSLSHHVFFFFLEVQSVRWDTLQPNRDYLSDSLENSNIEKLSALNQQLGKILLVLVVGIPYVWFIASMTFCVLSTLINS
jgi:hypothetical protein